MNCNEATGLLAAAVLGDLRRDQQRAVHAHLAGCDRCLEEEAELFESIRLLRAHGEGELDAGFHDSVMARAASTVSWPDPPVLHPNERVGRLTRTLLTAAATALIVVGLQTALESWPVSSLAGSTSYKTALAGRHEQRSLSLLDGTLFDRRRNGPGDLRQLEQTRRRGNTSRPLDL